LERETTTITTFLFLPRGCQNTTEEEEEEEEEEERKVSFFFLR
tara:strand:+ start:27 stop:155 length:129 start_codon:yes stop_codon:yes gene_type:complete